MTTVFPIIGGKKEQHQFYESWEETPITSFVEWQQRVPEMEAIEAQINAINNIILKQSKKYERFFFQDRKDVARREMKRIEENQKKVEKLLTELNKIEVSAISHFTTIPLGALMEMKHQNSEEEQITDNHIRRYKNRLLFLATQPLPTDHISEFTFQSKTDEEIAKMEERYSKLPVYHVATRRKLKKEIKEAKNHTYKVQDIWEQTTTINKEFQDLANDIVDEMKEGQFDSLPYLIAMLTVEENEGTEVLKKMAETNDAKAYVEKYMQEVKKIFERRFDIFTKQEKKLSIGTAIQIKNFFLHKSMS